jgi:hypothetical protein
VTDHGPNDIQYEKTDIDVGAVVKIGLVILAVTLVTAAALVPIIGVLKGRAEKNDPPAAPIAGFASDRQAPEPRLQREPFGDWRTMKKQQDELLSTYGWVDESKGVAHIPIEEAMKRLAGQGLPARPAPGAPAAAPAAPAPAPAAAPAEHHP